MTYIPPQYAHPCAFGCEDGPVDVRPGHGAYREVSGWEPIRSGGGGNTVMHAVRTGRYAHRLCVEKDMHTDPNQPSLL